MKRFRRTTVSAALAMAAAAAVTRAQPAEERPFYLGAAPQPAAQAAPAKTPPPADPLDQIKKPVDWLTWGADARFRQEYLHNPFLLDTDPPGHTWNDLRNRFRVWANVAPTKEFDFYTRLTWEPRYWWAPNSKQNDNGNSDGQQWTWNDGDFDNLYFRIKPQDVPMTFTVGRQDIILGDGWLVLDGTPLDGSETIYMDLAARLTIDFKEIKTTGDFIVLQNWSDPDEWLPSIQSESRHRTEQDELGVILWFTNKSLDRTEINPYFMYKHDDAVLANGDDGDIYTVGARIKHEFDKNWSAQGEGAYQWGNRRNAAMFPEGGDVSAGGFIGQIAYSFNDELKNRLKVVYEFLSGDDPDSRQVEQFDRLWARWPMWSELYIYTYAVETRIAEVTNLHRVAFGWDCVPMRDMTFALDYHLLFAAENTRAGTPGFSSGGDFRGQLLTAVLKYKFNEHVAAHLWCEAFFPGDYYDDISGTPLESRDDPELFLRWELYFTL